MKTIIISTIIALLLIVAALIASKNQNTQIGETLTNVTIVDGVQIVDLDAKGGYEPRRSVAQANIPTVVRFNTSGTYDCSTIVRIQSLKIQKNLPSTGVTEIDIGTQPVSIFTGSCGMGMYPFEIEFK